jgi:hypothetical protein
VPSAGVATGCAIAFTSTDRVVEYRNRRGVEQIDALTLVSKGADWWTAWSQFYF